MSTSIDLYPISISQLEDREMLAMLIGEKNDLIFVSLETYQVEKRTMLALGSTVNVGETLIQKGNNCIIGGNNIIGIVDINEGIVKRITKDKKLKTIKAMVIIYIVFLELIATQLSHARMILQ